MSRAHVFAVLAALSGCSDSFYFVDRDELPEGLSWFAFVGRSDGRGELMPAPASLRAERQESGRLLGFVESPLAAYGMEESEEALAIRRAALCEPALPTPDWVGVWDGESWEEGSVDGDDQRVSGDWLSMRCPDEVEERARLRVSGVCGIECDPTLVPRGPCGFEVDLTDCRLGSLSVHVMPDGEACIETDRELPCVLASPAPGAYGLSRLSCSVEGDRTCSAYVSAAQGPFFETALTELPIEGTMQQLLWTDDGPFVAHTEHESSVPILDCGDTPGLISRLETEQIELVETTTAPPCLVQLIEDHTVDAERGFVGFFANRGGLEVARIDGVRVRDQRRLFDELESPRVVHQFPFSGYVAEIDRFVVVLNIVFQAEPRYERAYVIGLAPDSLEVAFIEENDAIQEVRGATLLPDGRTLLLSVTSTDEVHEVGLLADGIVLDLSRSFGVAAGGSNPSAIRYNTALERAFVANETGGREGIYAIEREAPVFDYAPAPAHIFVFELWDEDALLVPFKGREDDKNYLVLVDAHGPEFIAQSLTEHEFVGFASRSTRAPDGTVWLYNTGRSLSRVRRAAPGP